MDNGIVLAELHHSRAGLEETYMSMVGGAQ